MINGGFMNNEEGKILFIDDDPILRTMTSLMLKKLGYTVLTASTPAEAIDLFKNEKNSINLFMTDVMMPLMNGKDLKKKIEELSPGIKTLFVSGYTFDVLDKEDEQKNSVFFLQKPFTANALNGKVREVLGFPLTK
jgi:two-component system, cell cycle sensor histidine kinase and response regulator CckA